MGPNAPGNLAAVRQQVRTGMPLPVGGIGNRRTVVSREGVVSALELVLEHPARGFRMYHLGHPNPVSTTDIYRAVAQSEGRTLRPIVVPTSLVRRAATVLRQDVIVDKALGCFVVSSRRIREELGWIDAMSPEEALRSR
jgi:nucleoside-diphosphate-sugar epimerase